MKKVVPLEVADNTFQFYYFKLLDLEQSNTTFNQNWT